MENLIMNTKQLKRYILDSHDDARLLIAERELNEFSDNAASILISGNGNNRVHEILFQLKIRLDEIDLAKVHKVLYCIFYNRFSADELNIHDVKAICQSFDSFSDPMPVFGLYQKDRLGDAIELIVIFE